MWKRLILKIVKLKMFANFEAGDFICWSITGLSLFLKKYSTYLIWLLKQNPLKRFWIKQTTVQLWPRLCWNFIDFA